MPEIHDSVAVVIPVYNGAATVGRAIDSVLGQTRRPEEIIVVDDGSSDATPEVVAGYGSRIRYHRRKNSGASAARNFGVHAATASWIAFLDHDDEWLPDKISVQMRALAANPDACLCYCAYWFR